MRRTNYEKNKFIGTILLLLVFAISIGYAVLLERLTIDNTISYDSMKWDIGFTSATDNGGTITSIPTISSDKKSITISCNIGTSTNSETCITKATITNNSTFNIMLSKDPIITYDNTFISSVDATWLRTTLSAAALDGIPLGISEDIQVKIITKELSEDSLPENAMSIPVTITMDWIEADGTENKMYGIGDEVKIVNEKFNIISQTNTTVTMLAQYNLGTNYKQSSTYSHLEFSSEIGWTADQYPLDIDIQLYNGNVKTYLNNYVSYLQSKTGDTTLSGNLITLSQLKKLDCTIGNRFYIEDNNHCNDSPYKEWLITNQSWWTSTARTDTNIFVINHFGNLESTYYQDDYGEVSYPHGVRPVITISKETLDSISEPKMISFYIAETLYQAEDGMTWEEWVNSPYNTDLMYIRTDGNIIMTSSANYIFCDNNFVSKIEIIKSNKICTIQHSGGA